MADPENTTTLPPPPVPSDLDIRRLWWMKLDIGALLNSEFNTTTGDDTAWRAGVTLWMRAWHQVPAGSLPDDDAALCHLAGLGRDLKTWKRIRPIALHGFTKCSDGRLYHGFLCKMAVEAHEEATRFEAKRQRERDRKAKFSAETPANDAPASAENDENSAETTQISGGNPGTRQDKTRQEYTPQTPRVRGAGKSGRQVDEPTGIGGVSSDTLLWRNRLSKGPSGFWLTSWGPKPSEPGCEAPAALVAASPWAASQGIAA